MITAFVGLSSVAAVMSLVLAPAPTPSVSPSSASAPDARSVEVQRLRAHFDSVLTELPAHDVSSFSRTQRSRRARLLATLQAYRDAGSFPHNYDFPGQPTPYFVDRKTGVLCAVAHLLESTGRRDIVDRVATANNNVYVAELATDSAFLGWLRSNGLTLVEAARIQVPYVMPDPQIVAPNPGSNSAYSIGSAIALGGSLAASLWTTRGNADGHGRLSSIAGFAASAASIGLGVAAAGDRTAPRAVAPLSLLAGTVTAYLSTRGLMRHSAYRTAQRDPAAQRKLPSASIAPILPIAGVSGAGLSFRLSF